MLPHYMAGISDIDRRDTHGMAPHEELQLAMESMLDSEKWPTLRMDLQTRSPSPARGDEVDDLTADYATAPAAFTSARVPNQRAGAGVYGQSYCVFL